MQVRILGPLEISSDGVAHAPSGHKQRILLTLLALRLGEVVSTDELIEAGWADGLPANPANTLQYQIAQVRKIIETDTAQPKHLITVAPGYRLDGATVTTDAQEFRSSVLTARQAFEADDHHRASQLVESALSIWRGPALAEFLYADFAQTDAERLQSEWISATELQVDIALAAGGYADAIPQLAQLTKEHPLREGLWARRALALYRNGQQSDSLRVLNDAREALTQVGLEASFELRDLERQILDQDQSLTSQPTRTPTPSNLPNPSNRLIGRDNDVANVVALLDHTRSVTLLGPGGAGKTRLAIAVGSAVLDRFPGGVWFVALDTLDDESLLAAEIGRISVMHETPDRPMLDTLAAHLGRQPTLLVLDNCEHLVAATATLVEELTSRSALLSVVATSQVILNTAGEVVVTVPPLTLPGETASIYDPIDDVDAVMLFVERAREAGASVEDWDANALAIVANIVAALDGLPLALELAAARTRSMSLNEIALGLSDRFATLSRGPRTAPDRQRSLLGAIEWSLGLLQDRHRTLIARLSVLAGGFDAQDAAAVAGEPLATVRDDLADLVDRSLLVRKGEVGGTARFAMLESLRQHGVLAVEPAQLDASRDRHLAHFSELARSADAGLRGADQVEWLHRIDAAYENSRAALRWSLGGGDPIQGMHLAVALGRYWDWRGLLKESSEWTGRFEARVDDPVVGLASVLAWRAFGSWEYGELEVARELVDRALVVARKLANPAEIAAVLTVQLLLSRSLGDLEAARIHGEELERAADRARDPWLRAWSASALSTVDVAAGDLDSAESHAHRSLAMFGELGDRRGETWALINLSQVALDRGHLPDAEQMARAALARAVDLEDYRNVLWTLEILADSAHQDGHVERSARLWGAAHSLRESRGLAATVSKMSGPTELGIDLCDALGESFDALVLEGRSNPDAAIAAELRQVKS